MKRLLRTLTYWLRRALRPSSVSWTLRDNDAWETECWREDDYRGTDGEA